MNPILLTLIAASLVLSGCTRSMPHHADPSAPVGQAAFAALSEVVAQLQADPATDWSKVNIDALRAHLLDMHKVTMRAQVSREKVDRGVVFTVTGGASTARSIQRMTRAHAATLAHESNWSMDVEALENGARVQVQVRDDATLERVQALGFFGLMTIGTHHHMHHLAMASGQDPHRH
ncbi:MAG: hypothetical protein AAF499_12955 [Pseudomonadota bacterium]